MILWFFWMDLILPRLHGHTLQATIGGIAAAAGGIVMAVTRWVHGPLLAVDTDTATTAIVGVGAGSLLGGLAAAGTALIAAATERKKVLAEIEAKREERATAARQIELQEVQAARRASLEERRVVLAESMTAELARYLDEIEKWANQVHRTGRNRFPEPPEQPDLPDALRIVRERVLAARRDMPATPLPGARPKTPFPTSSPPPPSPPPS